MTTDNFIMANYTPRLKHKGSEPNFPHEICPNYSTSDPSLEGSESARSIDNHGDQSSYPTAASIQLKTAKIPLYQSVGHAKSTEQAKQDDAKRFLASDKRQKRTPKHFYDVAADKFRKEFLEGSAIAPAIYSTSIQLLPDFQLGEDGDPEYPIREALGWKVTRFGKRANQTNLAAGFIQEDGSVWQLKLSKPRKSTDAKTWETKIYKYENPKNAGSRAYLPSIDFHTWYQIASAHRLTNTLPISVRHWAGTPTSLCSSSLVS